MPVTNPHKLITNRVDAIRSFHEDIGIERAQLDVSGGVDSAVMLMLLARAVGPNNITAVYTGIHSSDDSLRRAKEVAAAAKVPLIETDVSKQFDAMIEEVFHGALVKAGYDWTKISTRMDQDPTVLGSFRSCLRAPIGRVLNRLTGGGIRHGTGNECEDRWLRFYQKGGDGEVDTNPISMLSKGEVFQLGRALEVPRSILAATPSHDLHEGEPTSHDEVEIQKYYGVPWRYSVVNPDTGIYTHVGSIEQMSRFMDEYAEDAWWAGAEGIFHDKEDVTTRWTELAKAAEPFFPNFECEQIITFLKSAQAIEKMTRHKFNPNCPSLGDRKDLVDAGILTNTLPQVE